MTADRGMHQEATTGQSRILRLPLDGNGLVAPKVRRDLEVTETKIVANGKDDMISITMTVDRCGVPAPEMVVDTTTIATTVHPQAKADGIGMDATGSQLADNSGCAKGG